MWGRMRGCGKNAVGQAWKLEHLVERLPCNMDALLNDSVLTVNMPKMIVVQNRRLGFILRILQLTTVVGMIWYGFWNGGCYREFTPTGFRQSLWSRAVMPKTAHRPHCLQPKSYWYNLSHISSARPTGCKWLPHESSYADPSSYTVGVQGLFFPLHIQDEIVGFSSSCQNDGSCNTSDDFFLENPEDQLLSIFHGFEVGSSDGSWVARGVSTDARITTGPALGGQRSTNGEMVTHIVRADGSSCSVGGRSVWMAVDSQLGITGSLGEWLECAGVTLDTNPRVLSPDMPQGLAPHLRTMGFSLQVRLDYRNVREMNHVDCTMSVRVLPAWTVRKHTDIIDHPGTGDSGRPIVSRSRRTMGASVSLKVTGAFERFDFERTLRFFVDSIVLMQVPIYFIRFLALFCMGSLSSVYRRARSTKVSLFRDFTSALARMMVASSAYRHLIGAAWDDPATELPGLTQGMMFEQMRDVFAEPIQSGVLQVDDLRRMTATLFTNLDKDGTGEIGCSEFIQAFISHDAIKVEDVAHFFSRYGKKRKVSSVLRGWLDDSYQLREESYKAARQQQIVSSRTGNIQMDQEQAGAESKSSSSIVTSISETFSESGDARLDGTGINESQHHNVPGAGVSALMLADVQQSEAGTPRRSLKWLQDEIVTLRENTPRDGLKSVWAQTMQQQGATSTYASSSRELDYLSLLSALQVVLADVERRLEKLEIKDMEGQMTGWKKDDLQDTHIQQAPAYYLQVLKRSVRHRQTEPDRESTTGSRLGTEVDTKPPMTDSAMSRQPAMCSNTEILGACVSGDRLAKQ